MLGLDNKGLSEASLLLSLLKVGIDEEAEANSEGSQAQEDEHSINDLGGIIIAC